MSDLNLQVVLKLVDQMTAPMNAARDAMKNFGETVKAAGGGGGMTANLFRHDQIRQMRGEVEKTEEAVARLAPAWSNAASALGGYLAAHAGLTLARGELAAGEKAVHNAVSMETAGMSGADIKATQDRARELSGQFRTNDRSGIEALITETRSVVGGMHEALAIQPDLLRLKTIAEANNPGATEGFSQIVKGLEIAGVTQDMGKFHNALNDMAQTMNTFKKTIRPEDFYEFFKYAGSQVARNLDRDYVAGPAATLIQELKGSTAGFANRAFVSEVFASRLTGKAARQADDLGLVTNESKVARSKGGDIKYLLPGAIEGSDLAMHNPYRWVQEVLKPAMDRKGLDEHGRNEAIASIFENSNARQLVDLLLNQKSRIEKDNALIKGAKGLEAADDWLGKDAGTAGKAAGAQFENFKRQSAEPVMGLYTRAMQAIGDGLSGFTERFKDSPGVSTGVSAAAIGASAYAGWRGMIGGIGLGAKALGLGGASASTAITGAEAASAAAEATAAARLGAAGLGATGAGSGAGAVARLAGGPAALAGALYSMFQASLNTDVLRHVANLNQRATTNSSGSQDAALRRMFDERRAAAQAPTPAAAPEAAQPKVDYTSMDEAKRQAEAAGQAMKTSLNVTATPTIDMGSLNAFIAGLNTAKALLASLNAQAKAAANSLARGSGALHDGFETQ